MRDWTWYIFVVTGCIMLIILWVTIMRIWYASAIFDFAARYANSSLFEYLG